MRERRERSPTNKIAAKKIALLTSDTFGDTPSHSSRMRALLKFATRVPRARDDASSISSLAEKKKKEKNCDAARMSAASSKIQFPVGRNTSLQHDPRDRVQIRVSPSRILACRESCFKKH